MIRFRVLGPVEFFDGQKWSGISSSKQRTMLATLLLSANHVVPTERLISTLWTDRQPASAPGLLVGYAWRLRKSLGDPAGKVLVTRSTGYQLLLPPTSLDLHEYENLVSAGRASLARQDLATAVELFNTALAMYRDLPYADVSDEWLVMAQRSRLEESRLSVLEARIGAELMLGRHEALLPELTLLVAQFPLRERLCAHLMLALARSLNQADSLSVYRELRMRMASELGIEPSKPLRDLQQRILQGDPLLLEPQYDLPTAPMTDVSGPSAATHGLTSLGKNVLAVRAAHLIAHRFSEGCPYLDTLDSKVRAPVSSAEAVVALRQLLEPEQEPD